MYTITITAQVCNNGSQLAVVVPQNTVFTAVFRVYSSQEKKKEEEMVNNRASDRRISQ